MHEDERLRALEPLYSTKSGRAGIGLAFVHAVLKQHDGDVNVESNVDCGTVVTLSLPAAIGSTA